MRELIGRHLLVDLSECEAQKLDDVELIRELLHAGAKVAHTQLLDDKVHHFSPHGVTGIALLAESHLAIHTWPEKGYAALDLWTCREDSNLDAAVSLFQRLLGAKRVSVKVVDRGQP